MSNRFCKPLIVTTVFCTTVLIAVNCGGGGSSGNLIKASDGGTVCAPSGSSIEGACITIPANALSADTTVTFAAANDLISSPSTKLGEAVMLSPEGTSLNSAAQLTLPYKQENIGTFFSLSDGTVFAKQSSSDFFVGSGAVTADAANQKVTFPITRFGTYQAGFKVEEHAAVGKVIDIATGSSDGVVTLDVKAGEQYHFFVTSEPSGIVDSPDSSVATTTFTLTSTIASSGLTPKFAAPTSNDEGENENSNLGRLLVEQQLRDKEAAIAANGKALYQQKASMGPLPPPHFKKGTGFDFSGGATSGPDINETVSVKMLDVSDSNNNGSSSDTVTLTAEVKSSTADQKIYILVDNACTAPMNSTIDSIRDALDSNVVPRLQTFFGNFSDVDCDGRLYVVMTCKIQDNILGFFDAENDFENKAGSGTGASNEADVLFTTIFSGGNENAANIKLMQSTVCHELQHLINFNMKTLPRLVDSCNVGDPDNIATSIPFEEPFVNEGMSYMAENLCGYADLSAGPIELAKSLLTATGSYQGQARASLVDNSGSVSLRVRGYNSLYIMYLYQQAGAATQDNGLTSYTDHGGANFLKTMLSNDKIGVKNYSETFAALEPLGRNLDAAFKNFMVTLYNNALSTPIIDPSADPRFSYRAKYNDNFTNVGVGFNILTDVPHVSTTSGPIINDFTANATEMDSDVTTMGIRIIRYGASIDGLAKFNLAGTASGNLQAVVVRSQ